MAGDSDTMRQCMLEEGDLDPNGKLFYESQKKEIGVQELEKLSLWKGPEGRQDARRKVEAVF